MRRILSHLSIILCLFSVFSCNRNQAVQKQPDYDAVLNIYFFHLTERCPACTAVETETRALLNTFYKTQVDSGIIKFKSFNIDRKENKAIAKKYQISYTSLLLIRADGTVIDFTNNSLNYASMNPSKFDDLLKAEIDKNIE